MKNIFEKVATAAVILAAVAVSVSVVRREFAPSPPVAVTGESRYIPTWRELIKHGRATGDPAAPIALIEFSDLQCPFCKQFNRVVHQVEARYPGKIAHVFVHNPLASHPLAVPAARAAECAVAYQRFGSIVTRMFEKQDSLGLKPWVSFARDVGIEDTATYAKCANDGAAVPLVDAGVAAGKGIGVRGTPTVLLNGWRYGQTPTEEELVRAIDEILAGRAPYPGYPKRGAR